MIFFIGFVISVAMMVICPIIGWILSKDRNGYTGVMPKEPKEPPVCHGAMMDYSNNKSLEERFDDRITNIFRPWGGIFGD